MKSASVLIVVLLATVAVAFAWGGRDNGDASKDDAVAVAPAQLPESDRESELPPGHPPIDQEQAGDFDGELPPGHPPIAGGETPPTERAPLSNGSAPDGAEPVAPAKNGRTVAQIVRDAQALEGKKVKVAARVMRSTPNVLGRTWLRVQDGSGDDKNANHELVVTTLATPAVGEVVELEGTVVRNKDLGSGYRYDVLLEDATVQIRTR